MDSNILEDYFNLNLKLNEIKIKRDGIRKEILNSYPDGVVIDDYVSTISEKQGNIDYKAICETFLNLTNIDLDKFRRPRVKVLVVKHKSEKTNFISKVNFNFGTYSIFGEDD